MKKISFVVLPFYQQNKIFDLDDPAMNRDNCAVPFALLKKAFAEKGYDFSTCDLNPIETSEAALYLDMPKILPLDKDVARSHLLIYETDVISPANWDLKAHEKFRTIFTWNDSRIDEKKYFKMNWSYPLPEKIECNMAEKSRFCCLIAGNKTSSHPLELYSARIEAIRWFEKNHPDEFDLFGIGWNEVRLPGRRFFDKYRLLKIVKDFLSLFCEKFPSYKGKVNRKLDTLRKYRFSICYENARDIPGYITEKIFDCFFAGCIPVYWGPDNIEKHIPASCFIDKRKYDSYEKLYDFIKSMTDERYLEYINEIERFLQSPSAEQFRAEYFAESVSETIIKRGS